MKDAKTWFPISALLVSVIYTGSKSLVSRSGLCDDERGARELTCRWPCGGGFSLCLAIPFDSCIHHLQELDHHFDCEFWIKFTPPPPFGGDIHFSYDTCYPPYRHTERSSGLVVMLPVSHSVLSH